MHPPLQTHFYTYISLFNELFTWKCNMAIRKQWSYQPQVYIRVSLYIKYSKVHLSVLIVFLWILLAEDFSKISPRRLRVKIYFDAEIRSYGRIQMDLKFSREFHTISVSVSRQFNESRNRLILLPTTKIRDCIIQERYIISVNS